MNKKPLIRHSALAFCISAFCIATAAHGTAIDAMTTIPNVAMTSLSARQRYPWNGKVDIDFSFSCDIPGAYAFIQFDATYVDGSGVTNTVPMNTFDQVTLPWCTNAGTYRVTWDSTADVPGLQVTNLTYTVTANMAKYMVVNLETGATTYMQECPDPTRTDGGWTDEYKTTKMVFRLVQPGSGKLGWGTNAFIDWNCTKVITATFTRPFYLAIFECTQGQAKIINGNNWFGYQEVEFTGGNRSLRPVSAASWNLWRGSAKDGYCWPNDGSKVNPSSLIGKLRARTGSDFFDMPTENEWEYAARAGATDAWGGDGLASNVGGYAATGTASYNTNTVLNARGRYKFNGGYIDNGNGALTKPAYSCDESHGTAVVGSYSPNAWGFYDMLGNVSECTLDYYPGASRSTSTDSVGSSVPEASKRNDQLMRVIRGGRWDDTARWCALPFRNGNNRFYSNMGEHGCRIAWRFPKH